MGYLRASRIPKPLFLRLKPVRGGRIVSYVEVAGYCFLTLLVTFFLFSWYKRVPVISGAQGTAAPATVDIIAQADTAVLNRFVQHEQQVKKGQPLLEVTDDPAEVSLLHALAAMKTKPATNGPDEQAVKYAKWSAILSSSDFDVGKGKILTAPQDGWVIFPGGASLKEALAEENKDKHLFGKPPADFVDKGTVLLFLADFRSLRVTAKIPREQWAKKLMIGKPTKVFFSDKESKLSKKPVPGKLVKVIDAADAGREGADIPKGKIVTAEGTIAELPARAQEKARQDFFSQKMEKWRPAIAVTVDHERLLNQLRKPKPPDE